MTTSILIIVAVTALAVLAVFVKKHAIKPNKAAKWEKAEIVKQLLALSERENSTSAAAAPASRNLRLASAARSDTSRKFPDQAHKSKRQFSSMNPSSRVSPPPNQLNAEIEERIRQRAYELYQGRGGAGGNATDDWQQAREEVLGHKAKARTTSL